MKMRHVYCCYRTSLNSIKYFHFIWDVAHRRAGSNANVTFHTESSNHVDFHSKWLIHFVKLNFLVDFFVVIKINHFVFDFQTFISFVWIYEMRIDTNEPPHSTKPQNLINEICASACIEHYMSMLIWICHRVKCAVVFFLLWESCLCASIRWNQANAHFENSISLLNDPRRDELIH